MVRPLAALGMLLVLVLAAAPADAAHGRGRQPAPMLATSTSQAESGNGTLVVVVNATGGNGTFRFDATGPGLPAAFDVTTSEGTGNATFSNLTANVTRSLAMRDAAGFFLGASACSAGTPSNFTVGPNATVTCWFDVVRLARLVVHQNATGGDASFPFNATGAGLPAWFDVATTNGTGSVAFDVRPGAFTLAPLALAGWSRTAGACSDGAPDDLALDAGETVRCWFDAARLNTIVVRKTTAGGDGTFEFVTSGGSLPERFTLTTVDGVASRTFEDVDAGSMHAITEVAQGGWMLRSATCDRGAPANVTLQAGEAATCTFHNVRHGSVVVTIHASGGDAIVRIATDGTGGLPAEEHVATSGGTVTRTYADVEPGAHRVAVHPQGAWRVAGETCSTGAPADFTLSPNGTVTCTYWLTTLAEVRGNVYHDADRHGARDENESGLGGWRVFVDQDGDAAYDVGEPTDTTSSAGDYVLRGLAPGTLVVRVVVPAGWAPIAPGDGARVVSVANAGVATGVDFGLAGQTPATPPPPPPTGAQGGGPGYWKNWQKHGLDAAQVDAWMRDVHASSAWLLPTGYGADGESLTRLLEDATKQCNRRHGKEDCARLKLEARYLVLRLNLLAGHTSLDSVVNVGGHGGARDWLGLPHTATVRQVVDALEAKAGAAGADPKRLAGLVAQVDGEG